MVKQPKTSEGPGRDGPEKAQSEARQRRLEAALRENLKRRKQAARAGSGAKASKSDSTAPLPPSTEQDES